MKLRFYVAPQLNRVDDMGGYISSLLNDYIDVTTGESFTEIDNPARLISLCCVTASDATHVAIAADTQVITVSPLGDDLSDLKTKLDGSLDAIPSVSVSVIKSKLEAVGINMAWVQGSNTIRDAIRYLLRIFIFAQTANGAGDLDIRDFVKNNLDTKVSDVPLTIRNKIKDWMQNRGLAIGWIVSSTTVREILHFIVTNLGFGKFKMNGEEF